MIKNSELNKILKKYESILVEIVTTPNTSGRKLLNVQSFKDLLNLREKKLKPIYYIHTPFTCEFLYLGNSIYVYTVKESEYNKSIFEKSSTKNTDYDVISNIERNTYIKCTDGSEYLISPIDDLDSAGDIIESDIILPKERIDTNMYN